MRVLDLTSTFSGPYCTLMLADLGADVVKIEAPGGDIARQLGAATVPGMAAVFLNMNRGKRSVVLDLTTQRGQADLARLLPTADVLVHNMRPGAARRLQVSYEDCARHHPGLVYCAIPGFSGDSPHADRPAYDDVIQGASGLAAVQSVNQDQPGYVVTPIADKLAGLTAAVGVLAALRHRDATGEGQRVEVPMFDTTFAFGLLEQLDGWTFEPPVGPPVYPRTAAANRRPYRTRDGHLCVMIYTERQWRRFLDRAGRGSVLNEPRFDSIGRRIANADALYGIVGEIMLTRTTDEWLAVLDEIDVPCAPLARYEDLLRDGDLLERGVVSLVEHPTVGTLRSIAAPLRFSSTPVVAYRPAPTLGEHQAQILGTP
ncbi:CaiB/BaiF CoA transferase family protein [Micromonospora robiginosa]|uniref:CoA transferase n=1 Tax=Micromonospora robiginosa TaxID=2749844 RepID=A0A7L6B462_9ACTN|nr:CoA transferase [Micromonospora ferruginea]QLQ36575.2 CoA transferase [Micromonospora ferruginea]